MASANGGIFARIKLFLRNVFQRILGLFGWIGGDKGGPRATKVTVRQSTGGGANDPNVTIYFDGLIDGLSNPSVEIGGTAISNLIVEVDDSGYAFIGYFDGSINDKESVLVTLKDGDDVLSQTEAFYLGWPTAQSITVITPEGLGSFSIKFDSDVSSFIVDGDDNPWAVEAKLVRSGDLGPQWSELNDFTLDPNDNTVLIATNWEVFDHHSYQTQTIDWSCDGGVPEYNLVLRLYNTTIDSHHRPSNFSSVTVLGYEDC